MHAEITHTIPVSGTLDEINFSDGTNNLMWVRFDADFESWLGKFGYGAKGRSSSKIIPLLDSKFFILAGGQGYFFDSLGRKVLRKTDEDSIEDVIKIPGSSDSVLCNDGLRILVVNEVFPTWMTKRFSFDGISFDSFQGNILEGNFNDLSKDGAKFTFDIATRGLSCEQWFDFENNRSIRSAPKIEGGPNLSFIRRLINRVRRIGS